MRCLRCGPASTVGARPRLAATLLSRPGGGSRVSEGGELPLVCGKLYTSSTCSPSVNEAPKADAMEGSGEGGSAS